MLNVITFGNLFLNLCIKLRVLKNSNPFVQLIYLIKEISTNVKTNVESAHFSNSTKVIFFPNIGIAAIAVSGKVPNHCPDDSGLDPGFKLRTCITCSGRCTWQFGRHVQAIPKVNS